MEKHGQSQSYKSISRDLNVPVSTVCNIIKRFTAHGTVANLIHGYRKRLISVIFVPKGVLQNIKLRVPVILSSALIWVLCVIVSVLTFLFCFFLC